ncbi:hypothetical protein BKA69DRAFT_1025276 [Paraphysoderma sedebokerense]|nr:hypothetical protein BKA69DRAFT_1025375 [Paraphysoderma sedebokerense]KAI9145108.1 hypothetical protein BKA69DRAFT_1025276 [Paraphysoderma sedebokerense]
MYEAGDIPPPDDSDHSFGVATSAEPEERKAEPAEGNDDDDESGPDDESTSQCEPEDFERLFKPEAKIDWDAVAALTAEVVPKSHAAKATKQEPRFEGDLYTPLWVRGVGKAKEGLCRLCHPENNWFKIKISAFWYHLNFFHGVSSSTGRPFDPPEKERIGPKSKQREGFCGKCKKWISIGSPRNAVVNVPEIYWWKHAQKCHH